MKARLLFTAAAVLLFILAAFIISYSGNNWGNKEQYEKQQTGKEQSPGKEYACTHGGDKFCSSLPLVLIDTKGNDIKRNDPSWCAVSVIDNEKTNNHKDDKPAFNTASTIWHRGQSSYDFDKKQYGLEFYKKEGGTKENDVAVMGMSEESDWVLNGPYLDKTLQRNALMYRLAGDCMEWAPDTRFCEMFLDGEYQGVYIMIEAVKMSENRLSLTDYALRNGQTSYMLQRDRYNSDENEISNFGLYAAKTAYPLYIKYPTKEKLTKDEQKWINSDISEFERTLYSEYFDNDKKGYKAYIDMDSFAAYYVINEFSMNKDAGYLSTYVYKDLNGKLKMGPVWDFNNTFDNYQESASPAEGFYCATNNWFERLMQDREFVLAVCRKYHELRKTTLSDEYIFSLIEDNKKILGEAVERNFDIWGYSFNLELLGDDEYGNPRDIKSYEEANARLEACIKQRAAYLDENIELLYNYCIN